MPSTGYGLVSVFGWLGATQQGLTHCCDVFLPSPWLKLSVIPYQSYLAENTAALGR